MFVFTQSHALICVKTRESSCPVEKSIFVGQSLMSVKKMGFIDFFNGFYYNKQRKFRGAFNAVCASGLLILLFYQKGFSTSRNLGDDGTVIRRNLNQGGLDLFSAEEPDACTGLYQHTGYESQCDYLNAFPLCTSGGLSITLGSSLVIARMFKFWPTWCWEFGWFLCFIYWGTRLPTISVVLWRSSLICGTYRPRLQE